MEFAYEGFECGSVAPREKAGGEHEDAEGEEMEATLANQRCTRCPS